MPSPLVPAGLPPQDAEAFEAKRSRGRGEGGAPAWASARVEAKRTAEEAARLRDEIDEDDAFAVGGGGGGGGGVLGGWEGV